MEWNKLKELRYQNKHSQEKVARESNLSIPTIVMIEKNAGKGGYTPTRSTLDKLQKYFNKYDKNTVNNEKVNKKDNNTYSEKNSIKENWNLCARNSFIDFIKDTDMSFKKLSKLTCLPLKDISEIMNESYNKMTENQYYFTIGALTSYVVMNNIKPLKGKFKVPFIPIIKNTLMKYDPAYGTENPYPSNGEDYREYYSNYAWLYNPYSGTMRDPRDIGSDPFGLLIIND